MTSIRRSAGIALAVAVTAWFAWYAWRALPAIDQGVLAAPRTWVGVVVAAGFYAAIIPISGWAWARLLAAQGDVRAPRSLALLMARTQLAKYVPGNVAQHAMRMGLALRAGIRPPIYISTVLHETLLAVLASVVVGALALASDARGRAILTELGLLDRGWPMMLAVLALVAAALLLPRLVARFSAQHHLRMPSHAVAALPFLGYVTNYLLIGAGLALLARALELPASLGFGAITGAFALSWLLGFLAPGAPAGFGVREGLMVALLAGTAPDEGLLVFVVLARASTLLGDGLCFLAGWSFAGTGPKEKE